MVFHGVLVSIILISTPRCDRSSPNLYRPGSSVVWCPASMRVRPGFLLSIAPSWVRSPER